MSIESPYMTFSMIAIVIFVPFVTIYEIVIIKMCMTLP